MPDPCNPPARLVSGPARSCGGRGNIIFNPEPYRTASRPNIEVTHMPRPLEVWCHRTILCHVDAGPGCEHSHFVVRIQDGTLTIFPRAEWYPGSVARQAASPGILSDLRIISPVETEDHLVQLS